MTSGRDRSAGYLAGVAVSALALALALALATVALQQRGTPSTVAVRTGVPAPRSLPAPPPSVVASEPPSLAHALVPWALAADAIALAGLIAVLAVRRSVRRNRSAR